VCLHLAVADTGIGIPDGQLARVFEPFIQADGSHARKYGGTGLGLSIVKRLVSLMDGTLAISTKEGQGSEIHVSLWLSPVEAPAPEEADRPGPWTPPRRGRVLVVEDEPINRMAITRMLEMLGYVVSQAANGQEAIELLGRTAHDVVLMDVQMPVMDGIEATRRLRSGEAGGADPTVPVIALTAYAMAGDREMLLAAGADAYLSKPVDHELLVRELARLEQRRSSFSRP
jgi:two-component system CheB/CheR fusion protein